jgi:hypothetical protein
MIRPAEFDDLVTRAQSLEILATSCMAVLFSGAVVLIVQLHRVGKGIEDLILDSERIRKLFPSRFPQESAQ